MGKAPTKHEMLNKRKQIRLPQLALTPKSRHRRCCEIAGWASLVFVVLHAYRIISFFGWRGGFSIFLSRFWVGTELHALDYSLGFLPRAFSGSLLRLFVPAAYITESTIVVYLMIIHVLTYALLAVIMGMLIERALSTKNYMMCLVVALCIFMPQQIWYWSFSVMIWDTFLLLFALCAMLCVRHEKLKWFVPLLIFMGIATNFVFILLLFPLVFALMYYEVVRSGFKRSRLVHIISTTVGTFFFWGFITWAIFNDHILSRVNVTQGIEFVQQRVGRPLPPVWLWYISVNSFGACSCGEVLSLGYAFEFAHRPFTDFLQLYLLIFLVSLPICTFALFIWRKFARHAKGFWQKSPYLLFMIAPLAMFVITLLITDRDRGVWGALFTQILLLAYLFIHDWQSEVFAQIKAFFPKKHRWVWITAAVLIGISLTAILFSGEGGIAPHDPLIHLLTLDYWCGMK